MVKHSISQISAYRQLFLWSGNPQPQLSMNLETPGTVDSLKGFPCITVVQYLVEHVRHGFEIQLSPVWQYWSLLAYHLSEPILSVLAILFWNLVSFACSEQYTTW